jgi:predicted nucleic acid-binding protein
MNTVLVDSSAWIEYFRDYKEFAFIDRLIEGGFICTNDIILTELLPSVIHRKEYKFANILKSIYNYKLKIGWKELQDYQLLNIQHGFNKIGITDLIITQNCIQNNLEICSKDKHFLEMAEYLPIKIYKNT